MQKSPGALTPLKVTGNLARPTRRLTAAEFHTLADMPAASEWFANIGNAGTRRIYESALREFMTFVGIERPDEFGTVTRAHVIAWRTVLEQRKLAPSSLRVKLAAIGSLYAHLIEANAVAVNPVTGVKRPKLASGEGKTPPISDQQARALLKQPDVRSLKGKRDRAIISVLLFQALRRAELSRLRVKSVQERRGVKYFEVHGKGDKLRYVAISPATLEALEIYLDSVQHGANAEAPLFTAIAGERSGRDALTSDAVYKLVRRYALAAGLASRRRLSPHALRSTAATNALEHGADLKQVQQWLGHSKIETTRIYDHRESRVQDSPSFKVDY